VLNLRLQDWLKKEFSEEARNGIAVRTGLLELSRSFRRLLEKEGLSLREVARRLGHKSPSLVQRLVHDEEENNPTVETIIRFAGACGYALRLELAKADELGLSVELTEEGEAATEEVCDALDDDWDESEDQEQSYAFHVGGQIPGTWTIPTPTLTPIRQATVPWREKERDASVLNQLLAGVA